MSIETEVLYNGDCPICSREVDHYARITERDGLAIKYDDLSDGDRLAAWGISAEDAAKRLHVRKDGRIISGVPAFVVLWSEIPQMRWLARIVRLPVIHWFACAVYDYILAPALYQFHLYRARRKA